MTRARGVRPASAAWSGHYWTLRAHLADSVWPRPEMVSRPFRLELEDDRLGSARITGRLSVVAGASRALLLVHGLGGCAESGYVRAIAEDAVARGTTVLRVSLRGADQCGSDLYHAGLWQDLARVIEAPELSRYEHRSVVGFSLGGHLALRLATSPLASRLACVAAICPPLDLAMACRAFDACAWPYRAHVMRQLKRAYRAHLRTGRAALWSGPSERELRRWSRLCDWDASVVVPRYGYRSVEHYHASESASTRLHAVGCPTLLVVAERDPMIPYRVVEPCLSGLPPSITLRRVACGGHVGFPPDLDLSFGPGGGLRAQVLAFVERERSA